MTLQDLSLSDLLKLDKLYFDRYNASSTLNDASEAKMYDSRRDIIGAEFERREDLLFFKPRTDDNGNTE